jgi:oligoribonuclease
MPSGCRGRVSRRFARIRRVFSPGESNMANGAARLIWVDLEMTGLDCQRDSIIEIATVVTDAELNAIAEGPVIAIHQSDETLARMDEWNTRQHGRSGLTARVRDSRVTAADAERDTLAFLRQHVTPGSSPMCGNSICQDRRFLAREMPQLEAFFHYRNLDVSTLKILAGLWAPEALAGVVKSSTHLALADIHESIAELRHYREHLLRLPASGTAGSPELPTD